MLDVLVLGFSFGSLVGGYCHPGNMAGRVAGGASLFYQTPGSDVYRCASDCLSFKVCQAFDLRRSDRVCSLYAKSTNEKEVVIYDDYVYDDIINWLQKVAGQCAGHSCPPQTRCRVSRTNVPLCEDWSPCLVQGRTRYCLRLIPLKNNRSLATEICAAQGWHLSTLDTEEKNKLFKVYIGITENSNVNVFVAGNEEDGTWLWSNGRPLVYGDWTLSQPITIRNKENCIVAGALGWRSRLCSTYVNHVLCDLTYTV
ncbi:uncharacterized protein [Haliotis cracherodii]|uniref:uncharacterized protein n=1 Tax=Haliotis cracherodii TaxID=6455 RepID=UPI0039E993BF